MKNLSCEHDFLLSCKEKSFSQERFCTWPRFESEVFWNSGMAYFVLRKWDHTGEKRNSLTTRPLLDHVPDSFLTEEELFSASINCFFIIRQIGHCDKLKSGMINTKNNMHGVVLQLLL